MPTDLPPFAELGAGMGRLASSEVGVKWKICRRGIGRDALQPVFVLKDHASRFSERPSCSGELALELDD